MTMIFREHGTKSGSNIGRIVPLGTDGKRSDIQVLRAISVLAVVLFHAGVPLFSSGYLGVDVFFVISGFLVGGMILRAMDSDSFSFRGFYWRRARRLLPASFFTIFVVFLVSPFLLVPPQLTELFQQLIGSLTFTANYVLMMQAGYFESASEAKPLLHMWSLSLEEQFYFLFPVLCFFCAAKYRGRVIVVACLASLFLCGYLMLGADGLPISAKAAQKLGFFTLPARAWEMLFGTLAALFMLRNPGLTIHAALKWCALLVVLALCLVAPDSPHPGWPALLVVMCTTVLLLGKDGWIPAGWFRSSLERIGDWSYSIYLVHWPLFAFAYVLYVGEVPGSVSVALTIAALTLGWLQYRYVEQRFVSKKKPSVHSHSGRRLAIYGGVAMLVAGGAAAGWGSRVATNTDVFSQVLDPVEGWSEKCNYSAHVDEIDDVCFGPLPAPRVAVLGDSFAMHLMDGLVSSRVGEFGVVQLTKSACAPSLGLSHVTDRYPRVWAEDCVNFNSLAVSVVEKVVSVEVVVISSTFYQIFSKGPQAFYRDGKISEFNILEAEQAFAVLLKQLQQLGKKVVVVGPTPTDGSDVSVCNLRKLSGRLILGRSSCDIKLSDSASISATTIESLLRVTSDVGVPLLLPNTLLCDASDCITPVGGQLIYRDRGHLSQFGSRYVVSGLGLPELISGWLGVDSVSPSL